MGREGMNWVAELLIYLCQMGSLSWDILGLGIHLVLLQRAWDPALASFRRY